MANTKCFKCGKVLAINKYTATCQKCKASFLLCATCKHNIKTSRCPSCNAQVPNWKFS